MNKNTIIALVVVGLAAIAGGAFFVMNKDTDKDLATQEQVENMNEMGNEEEMEEDSESVGQTDTVVSNGSFKKGEGFCAFLSLEEAKAALGVSNLSQAESKDKDSCGYVGMNPVVSMAYGITDSGMSKSEYRNAMAFLGSDIEEVNMAGTDYGLWLNSVGQLHLVNGSDVLIVTVIEGDDTNTAKESSMKIAEIVLKNMQ